MKIQGFRFWEQLNLVLTDYLLKNPLGTSSKVKFDINYQNPEDGKSYNFQLTNKNPLLIGVGVGAKLGVLSLHTQLILLAPSP